MQNVSFEEFSGALKKRGSAEAGDSILRVLWADGMTIADAEGYLMEHKHYQTPRTPRRRVRIDRAVAERRIALAIWRECNRLVGRQMDSDARAFVLALKDRAEIASGIERV